MKRLLLVILLAMLAGCATEQGQGSGGDGTPACYRLYTYDKCKSCGSSHGITCKTCEPYTQCLVCSDVDGNGCWWQGKLIKCVNSCPSGAFLNGQEMP